MLMFSLCHALRICTQGDDSKPKAASGAPSGGAKVVKVSSIVLLDVPVLTLDCWDRHLVDIPIIVPCVDALSPIPR